MALEFASLNSGSNGNCYYVGNNSEAVLIDAGISCRETEKRMRMLGLNIQKVKAIFISHEHSDHIRGVEVLSRKHKIPVYITSSTLANCSLEINSSLLHSFYHERTVALGSMNVIPFSKKHDAADPYSFIVEEDEISIGVITDIGTACENVIRYFKNCHAAFLESNYDEDMLENGDYPYHLKRRIRSGHGHLSNKQSLELFLNHRSEKLKHLFLSHLSEHNNDPEIVYNLFKTHSQEVNIVVASRYEASEVYRIGNENITAAKPSEQLHLF